MSDNTVTMAKINRLMTYLEVDTYVIPSYNLPMPKEADGVNYREDKLFRLFRDGTMSYMGFGSAGPVNILSIIPGDRYLTRAYIHLVVDVRKKIKKYVNKQPTFPNLERLILKFNCIDFIDGDPKLDN